MPVHPRHNKHYCRWCDYTLFETSSGHTSAHTRWHLHALLQHSRKLEDLGDPEKCTKNCSAREQSDEQQHGVKLYGPGSTRLFDLVPLIKPYEELFPEDQD